MGKVPGGRRIGRAKNRTGKLALLVSADRLRTAFITGGRCCLKESSVDGTFGFIPHLSSQLFRWILHGFLTHFLTGNRVLRVDVIVEVQIT